MSRTRDFADLINGISAAKITSGSLDAARLSNIDSDYIQLRQATADLSNLNASNLTSGTIPDARISSGSVTQHVSAITNISGSWTPSATGGGFSDVSGRYHKTGNICICFADGKFSTRTGANDTQFFINGLPFTARNSGRIQGSGFVDFNSNQSANLLPIVRANESRIRLYTSAADMFTTGYKTTEYLNSVDRNQMITNRNLRQSSNNQSDDNFTIRIYYITA